MREYLFYVVLLLTGIALGAGAAVLLGLSLAGGAGTHRSVSYVDRYPALLSQEPWCKMAGDP